MSTAQSTPEGADAGLATKYGRLDAHIQRIASTGNVGSLIEWQAFTAAIAELEHENVQMAAALRPFADDKLPSSKPSVIAYNRNGLRCLMSPLEVARDAARAALPRP